MNSRKKNQLCLGLEMREENKVQVHEYHTTDLALI